MHHEPKSPILICLKFDEVIATPESRELNRAFFPACRVKSRTTESHYSQVLGLNNCRTPVSSPRRDSLADLVQKSPGNLRTLEIGNLNVQSDSQHPAADIAANGLGPDAYDLLIVGGTRERYAALKAGSINAGLLSQPQDFQIVDEGFPHLALSTDYL